MPALKITKDNFELEVLKSDIPVLLDFWAAWCGPCKAVAPILEEVCEELKGSVKVGKVNIDEQPELAKAFEIVSIPTFAVIKNSKVVNITVGLKDKKGLINMINE